jgi:hypothetical protein
VLPPALSLDASVIELVVITAPFVVVATALIGPVYPIYAMAAITLFASFLLRPPRERTGAPRAAESTTPDGADDAPRRSLWGDPRFWFWLAVSAAFGQSLGTLETGAVPLADSFGGGSGQAAILIAVLGVSSVVSGLGYAILSARIRSAQITRSMVLMAVMAVAGLGLGFADALGSAIAGYVVIGLCTAPLNTVLFYSVEQDVDPARRTEAFSSVGTANAIGFAVPGTLLAVAPLSVTFGVGGGLAVCALILAATARTPRRGAAGEENSADAEDASDTSTRSLPSP